MGENLNFFSLYKWPLEADGIGKSTIILGKVKIYFLIKKRGGVSTGKLAITPAQQHQQQQHDNDNRNANIGSS
jgi:hypothetical protein